MDTLITFRDHGEAAETLEKDLDKASDVLAQISAAGINLKKITRQLEMRKLRNLMHPMKRC